LSPDKVSDHNKNVENTFLESFDWLFSTDKVYHCKVADVKSESNSIKDIKNVFKVNKFSVNSDPSSKSILNIEFESENQLDSVLKIHDDSGNELYQYNIPAKPGVFSHQVDLGEALSNNIIISVHQENNFITRKYTIPK